MIRSTSEDIWLGLSSSKLLSRWQVRAKLICSNLEWIMGYKPRFGLTVVDREDGCKRYPKQSAYLLRDVFAHVKAEA